MTSNESQDRLNRHARECALQSVSRAINLAAPTVSYQAQGPLLLLGPEHRIRLAAARIGTRVECCGLVTEAMPAQVDADMEAAAAQSEPHQLVRLPLQALEGYLGRYRVQVEVAGAAANLAQLEFGCEYFATVLDLGSTPHNPAVLKPAGYFTATSRTELESAVEQAVALQGEFEKPRYITIHNDLCAHSGAELTGCTRCLDLCPADAIRSNQWHIEIDAHLCHGAGGCATACPTAAIRYGYPQPQQTLDACRRLLKAYREAGGVAPRLLIHDAEFGQPWYQQQRTEGTLDPSWIGLEIEELGAAGIELWLSALAWGAAEVALLAPPTLPDSIAAALAQELKVADAIVSGLALPTPVRLLTSDALLQADTASVSLAASVELPAGSDKRQQLSAATAYLFNHSQLSSGAHTRVALERGAPCGQVALNEARCTLCMACVAICPTAALGAGSDTPLLSFSEDACVQCGLCVQACPEDALALVPSYQLDPLPRQQRQVLKEEQPYCCIRCGKPFATQGAVALMLQKLAGHSMFGDGGLERLKMCADCRVADLIISDPGTDLFAYAKGREAQPHEVNLAQLQDVKQ